MVSFSLQSGAKGWLVYLIVGCHSLPCTFGLQPNIIIIYNYYIEFEGRMPKNTITTEILEGTEKEF